MNTETIPCGWCDAPVTVNDDHGQVVYCSETHARLNGYVPASALVEAVELLGWSASFVDSWGRDSAQYERVKAILDGHRAAR